jgi:hypothetical protein
MFLQMHSQSLMTFIVVMLLQGLYRCHECYLLCNDGSNLCEHLLSHRARGQTEAVDKSDDDLEDVPLVRRLKLTKPSPNKKMATSPSKRPKQNDHQALSPKAVSPKAVSPKAALPKAALPKAALPKAALPKAASSPSSSIAEDDKEAPLIATADDLASEDQPLSKRLKLDFTPSAPPQDLDDDPIVKAAIRPDRKCKSTTNTLVAISLADERYYDLEIKKDNASNTSKASKEISSTPDDKIIDVDDEEKPLAASSGREQRHNMVEDTISSTEPNASNTKESPRGRGRPKKIAINNGKQPPLNKAKKKTLKAKKSSARNTNTKKQSLKHNRVPSSAPKKSAEELIPDLVPPSTPSRCSKRTSAYEAEKASLIVDSVIEEDRFFNCLACHSYFANYAQLCDHLNARVCEPQKRPSLLNKATKPMGLKPRFNEVCDPEYSSYVSNAIQNVPECTFNNMHGTIRDINSLDGEAFTAKDGNLGALDKVKMNVSGFWSTKDVWESGGWEIGNDHLTWQKYESRWSCSNRKFLQNMSHLSWPEQKQFKFVYDVVKAVPDKAANKVKTVATAELKKKPSLAQGLDLKQLGRSVKYMNQTEREKRAFEAAAFNATTRKVDDLEISTLNGEWESHHDFMCSSCAIVYDELREVLHHKWDAHPYCLVAHVTLRGELMLPPSGMIHPQTGRNLTRHNLVKTISGSRVRNSSPVKRIAKKAELAAMIIEKKPLLCSKCPKLTFEGREQLYVHVLECGGDTEWDVSKKKKKKKRLVNGTLKRAVSTDNPGE